MRARTSKPALWTVLEVGELLWRADTVCEIARLDAGSARVRVLGMMVCDYTTPASAHAFSGNDTGSVPYTDTPTHPCELTQLWLTRGVIHVSRSEVSMPRSVELEVCTAAQYSAHESLQSGSGRGSDSSNVTTTDKCDSGILDYDCIAATQHMLPWGSQHRNTFSRDGACMGTRLF